ncbi:MAG TPA: DUF2177 family protein [Beijerinckiaceae bacterium]|nr:DUF2177 family protein [Beijerinckiaceae bacterium]
MNGNFLSLVRHYGVALAIFVVADMIWLGIMAPRFYKPIMGDIAVAGVNLAPAVAFYAIYPIGLLIFSIEPSLRTGSIFGAPLSGALFGFFTYLTYDLSNQATLRSWTTALTLVDITWGALLGAMTAALTAFVFTRLV